jgi:hypothetical protein
MDNPRLGLLKIIIWLAWLGALVALAAEPFRWEVDYFRVHGSLAYFRLIVGSLLLFIPGCILYVQWRRRGWYRYELRVIATAALCLAALEQPIGLGVGVLFFFASVACGRTLARVCGAELRRPAESVGGGFALGAAVFIPLLFVLGLLHAYYWPVFLLMLLAPLGLAWRETLGGLRACGRMWRASGELPALAHPLWGVGVLFLGAGVVCATIAALAPSIVMDAVKMHLPAAESYLAMHALHPVPLLSYSYYPQGFEVLMTMGLALGGQAAAQMITPCFLVALVLIVFEIARLCDFDAAAALVGVAAVLMTPFILWDGSQIKNDTELAVFQLAALYCCLRWRSSERRAWLILGAILLASSFGIKHVAAFGAVPLALLFIAPLYRKPHAVRAAVLFFVLIAALGFYWHTRTFLLTGDPLYPRHVDDAVRSKMPAARSASTWVSKRVTEPWLIQFHDSRVGFESQLRSPMGILLLALVPLALLLGSKVNGNRRACWFYAVLYLLLWGARMSTLRYALGPIALLTVLIAGKAKEAYDRNWTPAPRVMRFSVASAIAATLAYGLLGVILVEIVPGQLPLLAHQIRPPRYLRENLPGYTALESFAHADPAASVIAINACDRAYAPNPVTSTCVDAKPHSAGQKRLEALLNSNHFQYVILPVEWDEAARAELFQGYQTEDVYAGRDWRAVRLSPMP